MSEITRANIGTYGKKIERRLLRVQTREVQKDTGHGYQTTNQIAQALGLSKKETRDLLEAMAHNRRILRVEFANGLYWRTTNPLPWEGRSPPAYLRWSPGLPEGFTTWHQIDPSGALAVAVRAPAGETVHAHFDAKTTAFHTRFQAGGR